MNKNRDGFTLVEVLVSILIVAIVLIPLTFMFAGVIRNTSSTSKMLKANEIASMYMENIKAKNIEELAEVFGASHEIDSTVDNFSNLSLPDVPSGYYVKIKYDDSKLYEADAAVQTISADIESIYNNNISQCDFKIRVDKDEAGVVVTDKNNNKIMVNPYGTASDNSSRKINIDVDKGTNDVAISLYDGSGSTQGTVNTVLTNGNIVLEFGEIASSVFGDTVVNVNSKVLDKINVYVFEDANSTTNPTFNIESGIVSVMRNLKELPKIGSSVVEVEVMIFETGKTTPAVTLKGSVTNE